MRSLALSLSLSLSLTHTNTSKIIQIESHICVNDGESGFIDLDLIERDRGGGEKEDGKEIKVN